MVRLRGITALIIASSAVLALVGCGRTALVVVTDTAPSADGGLDAPLDAPRDGGLDTGRDGGMPDTPPDVPFDGGRCAADPECDDGFFCNGAERCAAGACVLGTPPDCMADRCTDARCDEASRSCVLTPRDNDGDGVAGLECGGEDCDDGDPTVFPGAPERCSGGRDDDCDGSADCADPECAMDPECVVSTCPDGNLGSALGLVSMGTTVGAGNDSTGTCRMSPAAERAFRWTAPRTGTYVFDTSGSTYDTVLYIRAGSCVGAELGCDDDSAGSFDSRVRLPLAAGDTVVLFVDGFGTAAGNYLLNVALESSAEVCTNMRDDDGDGLVDCADPDCSGAPTCCVGVPEICGNGADDDCDRAIDCADPDCVASPACCSPVLEVCDNGRDDDCDRRVDCADTECTTSPICCVPAPENCSNGIDDDCDALIDCADPICSTAPACCAMRTEICDNGRDDNCDGAIDCADPTCAIDPVCVPTCPDRDLAMRMGGSVATGTTVGAGSDQSAICGGTARGPDVTFGWTAPRTATYVFDTMGSTYDSVLHLRSGDCDGPELACDDDSGSGATSLITRTIAAGTRIVIVVDSFNMTGGAFVLNIRPVPTEVGRCADGVDNDADGFVDCVDPDCASDAICCVPMPEVCGDMIDNDCDRVIDCADPNCSSSPVCCSASPEVCGNFTDDDCDGFVDCVDSNCAGVPPC